MSSLTHAEASHPIVDRGARQVLLLVVGLFVGPEVAWIAWGPALAAAGSPSIESRVLLSSAVLALALPLTQFDEVRCRGFEIGLHIRAVGGDLVRGNRDGFPKLSGVAGRVARAHTNLLESLVPFAIVVSTAQACGVSTRLTVAASGMYLAARVVHATTYLMGVTVLRSAAFYAGVIATVEGLVEVLRHA